MNCAFRWSRMQNAVYRPAPVEISVQSYLALESLKSWKGELQTSSPWVNSSASGKAFKKGDVLFGKLRPYLAKVWTASTSGAYIGDFLHLRPQEGFYSEFLKYVMLTPMFIGEATANSYGSKMPRIEWEQFKELSIPVPPFAEQRRIAEFLDRETAEIDAFIADQKNLSQLIYERFERQRNAIFARLRTEYVSHKLKQLLREPLMYGANEPANENNVHDVRYLRITDFNEDGSLRQDTRRSLPHIRAQNYLCKPGDILLARSGATVGKAFIIPEELELSCFAGYLIRARLRKSISPEYVWHALHETHFKEWVSQSATVATIQNISAEQYGAYRIPHPPIEKQNAVESFLGAELSRFDELRHDILSAIQLSKERRAALISAAVTGQIDVSDRYAAEKVYEEVESST